MGDDERSLEERERGVQPLGRRLSSAELRRYDRSGVGSKYSENGIVLHHRRETLDYGELSLDVQGRDSREAGSSAAFAGAAGRGTQFQLQQFRHPLTANLLMDNALGAVRMGPDALVGNSYRVQLPGTLGSGVQSVTYGADREARLFSGRLGKLTGTTAYSFEETTGTVSGVGYRQALASEWNAGVQLVGLKNHASVADHQSVALAAGYADRSGRRQFSLHGLSDGLGHRGVWADGMESAGVWQHRYGAYRLPLDLLWMDTSIGNDTQGLYVRSDYRTLGNSVSVGGEFSETNYENNPVRAGHYARGLYGSGFYRASRDTNYNGSLSVTTRSAKPSLLAAENSRSTSASAGVGQRLPFGTANLRVYGGTTQASSSSSRTQGASWDHAWTMRGGQLLTALVRETSTVSGFATTRNGASANYRSARFGPLAFDGGAQFDRTHASDGGEADHVAANLNGTWTLDRTWSTRLQLVWARTTTQGSSALAAIQDKSIFISLRADAASGVPYTSVGNRTGALGSGTIVGWVYFDENEDGLRQASERPAAGIQVYLDGRYSATTDADGRFEFAPVPTGSHALRIGVERVPLPWGLHDEAPRRLEVPLRDTTRIDIPLTKISQ